MWTVSKCENHDIMVMWFLTIIVVVRLNLVFIRNLKPLHYKTQELLQINLTENMKSKV